MVPAVSVEGKKTKMISALQLTRGGLKKGEGRDLCSSLGA